MTAEEFAKATGYAPAYIRLACRNGRIPADYVSNVWDISPGLVPVWKAKKVKKWERAGKTIHNDVRVYQGALDEYNALHGTDYSYGIAVSKGLIG